MITYNYVCCSFSLPVQFPNCLSAQYNWVCVCKYTVEIGLLSSDTMQELSKILFILFMFKLFICACAHILKQTSKFIFCFMPFISIMYRKINTILFQ